MVDSELETRARALRDRLTPDEKSRLLSGGWSFYEFISKSGIGVGERRPTPAGAVPRLKLKGFAFSDGPRGISVGRCTCFPVPMARAATFSPELEERVGAAIGREARALGVDLVAAPCVNLLRHPAWGRAQETYGEDPGHLGEMGAAFARGLQKHVLACVKHFACNSIEDSRLRVDVHVDDEALDRIYLPAFARVVHEGVGSIMSAYNSVNGEWCSQNRRLLTTILKERWGFDGFVMSDFVFGVRDGPAAVNAGLDLEMPSPVMLGKHLAEAMKHGLVSMERVDDAVLRLIRQQLRGRELGWGNTYPREVIACAEHRALAREVATRAVVLLRNEPLPTIEARTMPNPVLPLDARRLHRLAVIGRLAAVPNTGDKGSSYVDAPYVITPLEGLQAALEPDRVEVLSDDGSDPARAAVLAAGADAAVVVVGYDYRDEGENLDTGLPIWFVRRLSLPPPQALPRLIALLLRSGFTPRGGRRGGDRESLTLHPRDETLLLAVAAANPRTVAVLMCGSAVLMERWRRAVPAILVLWYPGMEGGHALTDVLLGKAKPTGRLPFAIPTSEAHLPPFDPTAKVVEYGPLHGQALLDHLGVEAAYPFGFGLTYDDR
jgi:beta-glucosidase